MVPKSEIEERVKNLQKELEGKAAIIIQNTDRYYFSGSLQGDLVFVSEDDATVFSTRNFDRLREESPLKVEKVLSLRELPKFVKEGEIGLELDVIPYSLYKLYEKMFPKSNFFDVSPIIKKLRSFKSQYEVQCIKHACFVVEEGLRHGMEVAKEGMREIELQAKIEKRMREIGHQGFMRMRGFNREIFYGHLLSGWNGGKPSHASSPDGGIGLTPAFGTGACNKRIKKNEAILMDFVGTYEGYLCDETRIFVLGKLDSELVEAHNLCIEIEGEILGMLKKMNSRKIYEMALEIAKEEGFQENFMGFKRKINFIGHGVGLELDEIPVIAPVDMRIKEGNVLAIEPKMVFERGMVGVENTFFVGEKIEKFSKLQNEIVEV